MPLWEHSHMLTRSTRQSFTTLLDAITLTSTDDARQAIVYLETDQPPVTVTRADFQREVSHYAAALTNMGIQPRDRVVVAHTQNLESIFAFWGAMLVGAIPSMFPTLTEKLDPNIYKQSMAELVRLSDVRAVLTTDDFAPVLAAQVVCPVYGSS